MKQKINFAGFTIIELLVVIILLMTIGGLVGGIFFVSLRSANKSNKIAIVRQNGNAALTQMSRKIRYATDISFASTDGTPLGCVSSPPLPQSMITTNLKADGSSIEDIFSCPVIDPATSNAITMGGIAITDAEVSKIMACSFSCTPQATGSKTVTIQFDMADNNGGTGVFERSVAAIHFETSITMRNIQ
ncbi:hypothetical protein BH11PAT1_BH11PAT1_3130 [soil metagenome]